MPNVLIDPSNERKIADLRPLGFRDVMALGRYTYVAAHRPLARHTHGDMLEFCLLDQGEQPYVVEGERVVLKGGEILVILPHEKHGTGRSPENRGRLYWLLVRVPGPRERFLNLSPAEAKPLVQSLLSLSPRRFRGTETLKQSLERIFEAHDVGGPMRAIEIRNRALRFLLDVVQCARRRGRDAVSPVIAETLAYIDAHLLEESPRLEELARRVALSLSRFKARFKQEVGIAPGNYVILKKIEKAKELLADPARTITDVAMALGFSTSQYFATMFRRHTRKSPSEFRRGGASRRDGRRGR
ncbi:MAG: helix-turn-helix domain-containing protein [Planctomycetota bacterium]